MTLPVWTNRPPEEAHHFNPAYCGALIYEFVRSFEKGTSGPPDYAIIFCALPIALHGPTRDLLPSSTITALFPWLENTPEARIGFSERARNLAPYLKEAIQFAIARNALDIDSSGRVTTGPRRASFTPTALADMTIDIRDTVVAVRKIARWFSASGNTPTILSAWGVRI